MGEKALAVKMGGLPCEDSSTAREEKSTRRLSRRRGSGLCTQTIRKWNECSRGPRRLRSGDRRKAGTYPGAPGTRRKELGAHAEDKRVGEKSESRRNSRSNPDGEDGGPRRFREIKEEIAPALGDARRRQRCFISFASMKSPRGGAPPSARAPRFSFET